MALCRGGGNVTVCQLAHVIHSQRAEKKSHRAAWDVPNGLSAPFTKFPFQLFQKPRLKVKSSFTTTHPSLFASFLAFFFLPSYLFPFVTQKSHKNPKKSEKSIKNIHLPDCVVFA